ncbi:shikimate kinase [Marinilactibacillus sp. Marseille-P9653]|uniref:shikimate kinase n=1 Tax=Marinilactibacillus sp. Marseille-P9653 TaxID=2866583 RepID=UPI001CE4A378|nr:shikimate kinase [Marinilactibacillus sp. Marseille-P9653]
MKTNIVLIGMTGCGKTSFGKTLSIKLDRPFLDTDEIIEDTTRQTIPELFKIGEPHFRTIETTICQQVASESSYSIISCGGGVILKEENVQALKKTGWIVFIDRPVENIVKDIQLDHRPLLKEGVNKLYQLYDDRIDLYRSAADFIVENHSDEAYVLTTIEKNLPETIKKGVSK